MFLVLSVQLALLCLSSWGYSLRDYSFWIQGMNYRWLHRHLYCTTRFLALRPRSSLLSFPLPCVLLAVAHPAPGISTATVTEAGLPGNQPFNSQATLLILALPFYSTGTCGPAGSQCLPSMSQTCFITGHLGGCSSVSQPTLLLRRPAFLS